MSRSGLALALALGTVVVAAAVGACAGKDDAPAADPSDASAANETPSTDGASDSDSDADSGSLDPYPCPACEVVIHAAPEGTGDACAFSAPCSLTTARAKVRTRNAAMKGDVLVYLRGGTYLLGSTFELTQLDSGNGGHAVVWRAFPGETPVLSGGTRVAGRWTDALSFKAGEHAVVDHVDDVDLSKDFSICGWIKTSAGGTVFSRSVSGKWVAGGKTLFVEHGVLTFDVGWVGAVRGQKTLVDSKWHHVAVTYEAASNVVRLYADGAVDGEGKLKITADPKASQIRFGLTSDDFPRDGGNRLDGALNEISLYQRPLKAAEIKALAGNQQPKVEPIMAAVVGASEDVTWELTGQSQLRLHVPAGATPAKLKILIGRPGDGGIAAFEAAAKASAAPKDLSQLTHGGAPRWLEKLTSKGEPGADNNAYVSDKISDPTPNPWAPRMRFGGFDFFKDGKRAAICTWDGDVWIVDGIDRDLTKLSWQRIATGMFQPLGLKIVADPAGVEQIYVSCRDQITRLHDLNGDGEIDFYESFNNDHQVTEHFHEFAMGLQTDANGNFYYAKAARHALPAVVPQHGTVLKVDKEGKHTEIVCAGFRAANGFGLGPN